MSTHLISNVRLRLHREARRYVRLGFSVIPVRNKVPVASWKKYQTKRATDQTISQWFSYPDVLTDLSIGIVCGKVSGSLTVLDFDCPHRWQRFETEFPALEELILEQKAWVIHTPSGGTHVYLRSEQYSLSNRKLSLTEAGTVAVETRGEGGYVVAPCCNNNYHPLSTYHTILFNLRESGDALKKMVALLEEERGSTTPSPYSSRSSRWETGGDPVNALSLLLGRGWSVFFSRGNTLYLTRPGKRKGTSATWNHVPDRLHVFSSNAAPFVAGYTYNARQIECLLKG